MKVLMIVNNLERDLSVFELVKQRILELSPESQVAITTYLGTQPEFERIAFQLRPDVLFARPITVKNSSGIFYLLKLLFNTKIICFRAEGIVATESASFLEWSIGTENYGSKLIDYELFWGPIGVEIIGKLLYERKRISSRSRVRSYGIPKFECYFDKKIIWKNSLPERVKNVIAGFSRKNIIFFITGFSYADYTDRNFFDDGDLDAKKNMSRLYQIRDANKYYRKCWTDTITAIAAKHPELLIIVKKHPGEKTGLYDSFKSYPNIIFIEEKVDIIDVFPYAGLFFHYGSTTLANAHLEQVTSIYTYTFFQERSDWFHDWGHPSNYRMEISEVPAFIDKYAKDPAAFKYQTSAAISDYFKRCFDIELGRPYEPSRRIAELILDKNDSPQRIPLTDIYLWRNSFLYFYFWGKHLVKMMLLKTFPSLLKHK